MGETRSTDHRIVEFEALRGCLAWWVVFSHLYLHAGIPVENRLPFEFWMASGWIAVEVFIILSGYVIALLIETQNEPYGVFIIRRFFRLAPVYYLLLAVGVAIALKQNLYGDRTWSYLLLHLTMLHGMVPTEVLPNSQVAFIAPAWSISLEWQFYLIAPLVLMVCRRSTWSLILLAVCWAITKEVRRFYTFPYSELVVMRAGLFGVGIASFHLTRYCMKHAESVRTLVPFAAPLGVAVILASRGLTFGAPTIWSVIFPAVLAHHVGAETWLTRPIRSFLGLPFVAWLGKVSYSTYLVHEFVLAFVESVLGSTYVSLSPRGRSLALIGLAVPLILALSAFLYTFVEKPGIRLGKEIVSWTRRLSTYLASASES